MKIPVTYVRFSESAELVRSSKAVGEVARLAHTPLHHGRIGDGIHLGKKRCQRGRAILRPTVENRLRPRQGEEIRGLHCAFARFCGLANLVHGHAHDRRSVGRRRGDHVCVKARAQLGRKTAGPFRIRKNTARLPQPGRGDVLRDVARGRVGIRDERAAMRRRGDAFTHLRPTGWEGKLRRLPAGGYKLREFPRNGATLAGRAQTGLKHTGITPRRRLGHRHLLS